MLPERGAHVQPRGSGVPNPEEEILENDPHASDSLGDVFDWPNSYPYNTDLYLAQYQGDYLPISANPQCGCTDFAHEAKCAQANPFVPEQSNAGPEFQDSQINDVPTNAAEEHVERSLMTMGMLPGMSGADSRKPSTSLHQTRGLGSPERRRLPEWKRFATNKTREIGACIRCRKRNVVCVPKAGDGGRELPCQTCEANYEQSCWRMPPNFAKLLLRDSPFLYDAWSEELKLLEQETRVLELQDVVPCSVNLRIVPSSGEHLEIGVPLGADSIHGRRGPMCPESGLSIRQMDLFADSISDIAFRNVAFGHAKGDSQPFLDAKRCVGYCFIWTHLPESKCAQLCYVLDPKLMKRVASSLFRHVSGRLTELIRSTVNKVDKILRRLFRRVVDRADFAFSALAMMVRSCEELARLRSPTELGRCRLFEVLETVALDASKIATSLREFGRAASLAVRSPTDFDQLLRICFPKDACPQFRITYALPLDIANNYTNTPTAENAPGFGDNFYSNVGTYPSRSTVSPEDSQDYRTVKQLFDRQAEDITPANPCISQWSHTQGDFVEDLRNLPSDPSRSATPSVQRPVTAYRASSSGHDAVVGFSTSESPVESSEVAPNPTQAGINATANFHAPIAASGPGVSPGSTQQTDGIFSREDGRRCTSPDSILSSIPSKRSKHG